MRVGVLTGGGDCPGLNAVIRAVVRRGIQEFGLEFVGFRDGWRGPLEADTVPLDVHAVRDVLPRLQGAFSTVLMTKDTLLAFRDPRVLNAIRSGANQSIAVAMFQWTGPRLHAEVVPWMVIKDAASAEALAAEQEGSVDEAMRSRLAGAEPVPRVPNGGLIRDSAECLWGGFHGNSAAGRGR